MLNNLLIVLYKYKLIIYLYLQAIKIQLYKLYKPDLLAKIFTKSNLSKVIIIFTIGLISRVLIGLYYDVNVFKEYYKSISLIYYSVMAIFIVILGELFTYFNLNILPSFIFDHSTLIREYVKNILNNLKGIYMSLKEVNKNISHLKISGFTLRSITSYLSWLNNEVSNIFTKNEDKLTLGKIEEEDNIDYLNKDKTLKISNILHKGKDRNPKSTYKPGSTSVATPIQQNSEASASVKSSQTLPFVLLTEDSQLRGSNRLSNSNIRNQLRSSSIYSEDLSGQINGSEINCGYNNFPLYQESMNSDFATPKTMTPLFGGSLRSNSLRESVKTNGSNHVSTPVLTSPTNYPAPLTLAYDKTGDKVNISFNRNSRLATSSFDSSSTYSRNVSAIKTKPYGLSGNGVLPNVAFSHVNNGNTYIPLDSRAYNNHTLPVIPRNYDNNLDAIADSSSMNDPCSFHYRSRHKPHYTNETGIPSYNYYNSNITQASEEVVIKKQGIVGKVKLGFKTLGSKFSNGINKIENVYIKYETVGKRHIIWNLFEENSGSYESYEDFKNNWDSKTSLWKEIKDRTKKDLKMEIESLLGISNNKPAIGSSVNREIEDILRTRRPFTRSANNTKVHENNPNVINAQEESNNNPDNNREEGKRVHKDGHHHHSHSKSHAHRHGHHHKHSYRHGHHKHSHRHGHHHSKIN